jgi:RNA polymerase sigma-70 factor (ECF subfamily)
LFFKKKHIPIVEESEMIRMAKQDARHFGLLYERYFDQLFRFIFKRIGGNEEQTADLTQQTFLLAMTHIQRYEDRGFAFSSWLYRIAQNEINQYFRKNKGKQEVDIHEHQLQNLQEEMQLSKHMSLEDQELLVVCINELEAEQMDLIELRFFQELSFKEISEIYSISEANAKMRVYRILEKINKMWKQKS